MKTLVIRAFQVGDQEQARAIVLEGMGTRWGHIDYSMNRDLDDIQANYVEQGSQFFVGEVDGEMVATCALTFDVPQVGRIERMSVRRDWQGKGFGRILTNHLIKTARACGCHTLKTETETAWSSAIKLYQSCGFVIQFEKGSETHMRLTL